ncbi:MAG TPA: tryptophan--tRNA ligase, partial [Bdellovibrionota bacterium]|nr:tryptophan--tRNA ligase [Bdellovibrionota bacterium]
NIQTYGFIGYPVLQAADILIYHGDGVPIGQDQLPHLELTREIVRRFNHLYGELFKEPLPIFTEAPKVPGTDGRKMSKSYGNAIYLADSKEEVEKKVRPMKTDIARVTRKDPGNPDVCPVFDLHKIYTPPEPRAWCDTGCRTAGIGCLDCKLVLLEHLQPQLDVVRERRKEFLKTPKKVDAIIAEGNRRAHEVASKTLGEVRKAIGV